MPGRDLETARTLVVNTIVTMEIFYLFNVRYLHMTSFTLRTGNAGFTTSTCGTSQVCVAAAPCTVPASPPASAVSIRGGSAEGA